jgi:hypothetical protein
MTIDAHSLEQGEHLLWQGTPEIEAFCARKSLPPRWVGLSFLALGLICAVYEFLLTKPNPEAVAFIIIFLVIAGAILYLPLRFRRNARRTRYALTDRRAIIETPGLLLRNRVSVPFAEMRLIETNRTSPGDLLFRDYVGGGGEGPPTVTRDGFFAIANVEDVERLLRAEIVKATARPSVNNPR